MKGEPEPKQRHWATQTEATYGATNGGTIVLKCTRLEGEGKKGIGGLRVEAVQRCDEYIF